MNTFELMNNFSNNISKYQQEHKLTNKQMADKIGVSVSTYRNIISRRVEKIGLDTIIKICTTTEMYLCELCNIKNEEIELTRKIRQLPKGYLNYIEGKVDFYLDYTARNDNSRAIPVIVPAGEFVDGMNWISAGEDVLHGDFNPNIYCGIKVTSNHLSPVFVQGDILLIEKRHPKHGEIGIFINNENSYKKAYCKIYKYGNPCVFASINDCGIDIEVNPNNADEVRKWTKYGVVASVWRGGTQ